MIDVWRWELLDWFGLGVAVLVWTCNCIDDWLTYVLSIDQRFEFPRGWEDHCDTSDTVEFTVSCVGRLELGHCHACLPWNRTYYPRRPNVR